MSSVSQDYGTICETCRREGRTWEIPDWESTNKGIVLELPEDALHPIIPVIKDDINWYWLQYSFQKDTSSKLVASWTLYH